MKTKMPSILKVNYPTQKVDTEFFFLKIPNFSLHVVQIPINLPTRENIPRLCRVVEIPSRRKDSSLKIK